jgi:pimeloyl-ACP methyl ester carboxylesterase
MKSLNRLLLILCACISLAEAQTPAPRTSPWIAVPHVSGMPRIRQITPLPQVLSRVAPAGKPASATAAAITNTCSPDAQAFGAICGYVNVPLDRKHPSQATLAVYYELYHFAPGAVESAIVVNFGGPGPATSAERPLALYLYGQNLDKHDLLLIDDRGRGLSGLIDCEEFQHATAPWEQSVADCAAQLGNAASRYGTGDIAKDVDAVRAALGYDKVDYHGGSYGGADASAYATRFPSHLRSIVLDAPFGPTALDPFVRARLATQAVSRTISLLCSRSPSCAPDHRFPVAELNALIARIQRSPVEGSAYDSHGNILQVRMDESALMNFVLFTDAGSYVSNGEVLAAGQSLAQGDPAPLLRLGAEGYFPLIFDSGDPAVSSVGAAVATDCVDARQPWDWSESVPERKEQFAGAVAKLASDYFAPFSKSAATKLPFNAFAIVCQLWEKPTPSSPVVPPNAVYPKVPTLVLGGDVDTGVPLEQTAAIAALFPRSTLVPVAEAGHETVFWTQCAKNLAASFIDTLKVGDLSCTQTPEVVFPAVGRFPVLAKFARPANPDPSGQNQIAAAERKVVTVAVATVTDALQRGRLGFQGLATTDGVGLRAGTIHTDYVAGSTTLSNCAFSKDVIISGTINWSANPSIVADLVVSGPGTAGGTLHIDGTVQATGPVGNLKVTGTLGGKRVAVLVPNA